MRCPGLDDTDDCSCPNLIIGPGYLCGKCSEETVEIYNRMAKLRKEKESVLDLKADKGESFQWVTSRPTYRVLYPVILFLAIPTILIFECFRPFVSTRIL